MALRQLYSAESTCSRVSLSTWSWKTLTWSMNDTTRSADMGEEWKPAAASNGAMWSGKADWAALRMNSSLQLSLSRATCGFVGMLVTSTKKKTNAFSASLFDDEIQSNNLV